MSLVTPAEYTLANCSWTSPKDSDLQYWVRDGQVAYKC